MSAHFVDFKTFMDIFRKWSPQHSSYFVEREDREGIIIFSITLANGKEYISSIAQLDFNPILAADLSAPIVIQARRVEESLESTNRIIKKLEEVKDATKPISNQREDI